MKRQFLAAVVVMWGSAAAANGEKIYYQVLSGGFDIYRANLDFSNAELIIDTNCTECRFAVDTARQKIYYSVAFPEQDRGIYRANLDGSNPDVIVPNRIAYHIASDTQGGIYFATGPELYYVAPGSSEAEFLGQEESLSNIASLVFVPGTAFGVPAISSWGLLTLAIGVMAAGTVVLRRRRQPQYS